MKLLKKEERPLLGRTEAFVEIEFKDKSEIDDLLDADSYKRMI